MNPNDESVQNYDVQLKIMYITDDEHSTDAHMSLLLLLLLFNISCTHSVTAQKISYIYNCKNIYNSINNC